MSFATGNHGGLPSSIKQGPDGLLHLAEVAASLDAPRDPAAARALAEHISASVTAFSQALAAQLLAANGPARNAPAAVLPQRPQQVHQQLAPPQPPSPRVNADNASDVAAALLQHLASLKGSMLLSAAPLAGQLAGPQQQLLHPARQAVAGSAAVRAASAAAHRSDAALQATLSRAGPAAAPAHCTGFADEGFAAFMPMPSARLPRSSRSSPVRNPAAAEEDCDYSPTGPNSSSGGGKPQQWTGEEQARLEALVAHHGTRNWSTIASSLPGRTGKQCRERYINNTPELKKGNWTLQEDLMLAQLHSQMGNRWTAIARQMPGRSDNCVKNRWNAVQRSRSQGQARGSSSLLWGYSHRLQQGLAPADALAAAIAALPVADRQQLEAAAGAASVAAVAAPVAAVDRAESTAAAATAAAAAAHEDVHPAALLPPPPQQQQPAAAEPAQGRGRDDALAMAAAMVLKAAASQLATGGGSIPKPAADALAAAAAAVARAVATAEAKQAAAPRPSSTAAAVASAAAATAAPEPGRAEPMAQYAAAAHGGAQLPAVPPVVLAQALADTPIEQLPVLLQSCMQQPLDNSPPAAYEQQQQQPAMAQHAALLAPQFMQPPSTAAAAQQQPYSEPALESEAQQQVPSRKTQTGGRRRAQNKQQQQQQQQQQPHDPAADWQQPQAPAHEFEFEQQQMCNMQQNNMTQEQQMAAGMMEAPQGVTAPYVVGSALQQALSAATAAAASGNARAAAAAVVAATGMVRGSVGGAHHYPAAALAAGASAQPLLDLPGSQQQQHGSRKPKGKAGSGAAPASVAAAVPEAELPEMLHPSSAAAQARLGSTNSGLSGLVLDSMGYQQQQPPQQARLCSLAAGALSSAAPTPCIGKRLLAARKDRQKALEQYLALNMPPLPPPQQQIPAPEEVLVAETRQQQQQHWPGSQQQTAPPPPPAAAEAAAAAVAAEPAAPQQEAAVVQQANTLAAAAAAATCQPCVNAAAEAAKAAGASAQQVALMKLAATAEGRALLDNLRALQLLPAELPAGAQLTLQLVVQPPAGTAPAFDAAEAAAATAGTSASAGRSVPAVTADGAAAVCFEPSSPAGSNCSSRSKAPAVDAAGAAQAASGIKAQQYNAMQCGDSLAAAVAASNAATTTGTTRAESQQQPTGGAAAAANALQHANTYTVGSKRPISAVLPGEALSAAIAAAKRVLHNPPPWRGQAAL